MEQTLNQEERNTAANVCAAYYDPVSTLIPVVTTGTLQHVKEEAELRGMPFILVPPLGRQLHSEYRVVDGALLKRPKMEAYIEGNVLHNAPIDAEVQIENSVFIAEGGPIELDLAPGMTYRIAIMLWPYQDQEIEYAAH